MSRTYKLVTMYSRYPNLEDEYVRTLIYILSDQRSESFINIEIGYTKKEVGFNYLDYEWYFAVSRINSEKLIKRQCVSLSMYRGRQCQYDYRGILNVLLKEGNLIELGYVTLNMYLKST